MKVKVIKECWFEERHFNPNIEENVIVEYPCDDVKNLPSWAEVVDEKKQAKEETKQDVVAKEGTKQKVKELPISEKNLLIERASKVGIAGNQILSWNVSTLEAKILEAEAKEGTEE